MGNSWNDPKRERNEGKFVRLNLANCANDIFAPTVLGVGDWMKNLVLSMNNEQWFKAVDDDNG